MKHRDGYLISVDDVMQLELEVIEDIAYRVFKDSYLTEEAKLDILDVYLDCRWRKKEKTFVYNEKKTETGIGHERFTHSPDKGCGTAKLRNLPTRNGSEQTFGKEI